MKRSSMLAVLLLGSTVAGAENGRKPSEIFRWAGPAQSGQILHFRNLNGSIRVTRAAGPQIEVVATAWRRDGEAIQVRVERRESGKHMAVCALWPAQKTGCEADGEYGHEGQLKDAGRVRVDLEIAVPAGLSIDAETTNGDVVIEAPTARVSAVTVNGDLAVRAGSGPATATTVNGNVKLDLADGGGDSVLVETVNGNIDLATPAGDLTASVLNGAIKVDGLRVGKSTRHRLGAGGRAIRAETVNGNVAVATR